jgi:hypothetical protein
MMDIPAQMTLDELRNLATARYQRYVDWYDHTGMDSALKAEFDEALNEIEQRRTSELTAETPRSQGRTFRARATARSDGPASVGGVANDRYINICLE